MYLPTKISVPFVLKITVLMTSLYVVANNLPPVVGSFRYFWGPAALLSILLSCSSVFKEKAVLYLMLYATLSLGILQYTLWKDMPAWHRIKALDEFYSIFIFAVILFYYYRRKDYKGLASVGKLGFYFVLITIIMTNIALFFDPMTVRQSASPGNYTHFQAWLFNITGAASYGYAQALCCLIPVLVYYIKSGKKMIFHRKGLILVLVLILVTLVRSKVFANVLVAFVITIFSLAGARSFRKSIVIVVAITIIFLIIPTHSYVDMLLGLSSHFDKNSIMYNKLTDAAQFVQDFQLDWTTGAGGRMGRYPFLFEELKISPLLGAASDSRRFISYPRGAWTHLYWMYRLALWGVPGFLFFVFVLFQIVKAVAFVFDTQSKFYYLLCVGAFVLLGLMKNIAGREPFLMLLVIIPGLYFQPLLDRNNR